jgi:prepilin-type N-terminal cleavage/methylation domain-containing protein
MSDRRPTTRARRRRAFTLIELIVAIGVSVVLLAILTFVFQVSTSASRDANSRVSLTERLRSLNLRLRQEVSGMVHKIRDFNGTDTYDLIYGFGYTAGNPPPEPGTTTRGPNVLAFATSTVQDGKPVTVDVCYVFQPGGITGAPIAEQGRLIRLRDRTGPEAATQPVNLGGGAMVYYQLGDDRFWAAGTTNNVIGLGDIPTDLGAASVAAFNSYIYTADVMMINVRSVQFFVVDPPPTGATAATQLNPRTLPAGIRMVVLYGPEVGNIDQTHRAEIHLPVQRGL